MIFASGEHPIKILQDLGSLWHIFLILSQMEVNKKDYSVPNKQSVSERLLTWNFLYVEMRKKKKESEMFSDTAVFLFVHFITFYIVQNEERKLDVSPFVSNF